MRRGAFQRFMVRRVFGLLAPGDDTALRALLNREANRQIFEWQDWSGTLEDGVRLLRLEVIELRSLWHVPEARLTRLGWLVARSQTDRAND